WKIWMAIEIKTWEISFLENRSVKLHVWKQEGPRCKEIDEVGEVTIIWNLVCVVVMLENFQGFSVKNFSGKMKFVYLSIGNPILRVSFDIAKEEFIVWSFGYEENNLEPRLEPIITYRLTLSCSLSGRTPKAQAGNGGYTTSPGSSSSKGSSKSKCSVVDDVIYSFFANHKIDQHLVYEDLDQMNKEDFEEYDLQHQMAMLSIKDKQTEEGNTDPRSLENFGMLAGIKLESDADSEGVVVFADDVIPAAVFVSDGPIAAAAVSISAGPVDVAAVSPQSETEFALMGLSTGVSIPVTCHLCCDSKYKLIEKDYHEQREQLNDCVVDLKAHKHAVKSLEKQIKCHQTNQLAYEEKIRVLSYELKDKSNILEYRQKLIDHATQEKHDLMTK
nr:hypothetical protein [Tanacetum cinerariifolium]